MTHPIEAGAMARTIRDTLAEDDMPALRAGTEFTIEDYVSAEESEDGEAFYWASNNGGYNNIVVRENYVEPVRSKTEMDARRIPTLEELLRAIAGNLEHYKGFNVDESDVSLASGTVDYYGTTDEGLGFGFTAKITSIEQVSE